MSFAGLIMDVLLVALLLVALGFGVRLERKLKALRQGQEDFGRAVGDLDRAAARAEAGLASLKAATDEAHDSLHDRILKARELRTQLESIIARAERLPAAGALAAPPRAAPAPRDPPERSLAVPPMPKPKPSPAIARRFDEDLFEPAGDRL